METQGRFCHHFTEGDNFHDFFFFSAPNPLRNGVYSKAKQDLLSKERICCSGAFQSRPLIYNSDKNIFDIVASLSSVSISLKRELYVDEETHQKEKVSRRNCVYKMIHHHHDNKSIQRSTWKTPDYIGKSGVSEVYTILILGKYHRILTNKRLS